MTKRERRIREEKKERRDVLFMNICGGLMWLMTEVFLLYICFAL